MELKMGNLLSCLLIGSEVSPMPLTRPSMIPMLPQHHPDSRIQNPESSQEAIQVATLDPSPKSGFNSRNDHQEYRICSSRAMCGPHPKKVTIVVALVLSIWASFILGINIHKKVSAWNWKYASFGTF